MDHWSRLVCLSFLTPGILFSFIFIFDPHNIFQAFDVILNSEFLHVQAAEEVLVSALLLYYLEVSELFLHL